MPDAALPKTSHDTYDSLPVWRSGDGESMYLRSWQVWLQWCEGVFEPLDHAALPERQL